MLYTLKRLLPGALFLIVLLFTACSTSEELSSEPDTLSPAWYSPTGFASDSLMFHGYATAISSDSVIAVANAGLQARANLESGIAGKLEGVREILEESGAALAKETDFIITLRNAHNSAQAAAAISDGEARTADGYYTGFVQVSISKKELRALLESGFAGKTGYWQELSSSSAFADEFE